MLSLGVRTTDCIVFITAHGEWWEPTGRRTDGRSGLDVRQSHPSVDYNGAWYRDNRQMRRTSCHRHCVCTNNACLLALRWHPAGVQSHDPTAVVAVLVAALEPWLRVVPLQVCQLLRIDSPSTFPTTHTYLDLFTVFSHKFSNKLELSLFPSILVFFILGLYLSHHHLFLIFLYFLHNSTSTSVFLISLPL